MFETGQIKCWGHNSSGQLGYGHSQNIGDAEKLDEVSFVDVGGAVISMALGWNHTCVLLDGGGVKCWGDNRYGQLGLGHTENIGDDEMPSSVEPLNLGQVLDVATGWDFSCARLLGGGVKCWGRNHYGQLGLGHRENIGDDETLENSALVSLGAPASQLSLGQDFSCAILGLGRVRCWGYNYYGQLGQGHQMSIGDDELPSLGEDVELPSRAIMLSTGNHHSCTLLQSGKLVCWGENYQGQLGLAHRHNIGDNEAVDGTLNVEIGEGAPDIYPRFLFSSENLKVSVNIRFDASNSFSKIPIKSYSWSFGNGEIGSGESVVTAFSMVGNYRVRLTLTDIFGRTSSVENVVRVHPVNDSPIMPQDQKFTIEENKISQIDLAPAMDSENDSLVYQLVDNPSHGNLSNCLSGGNDLSCKYIPPNGFMGTVTFSYQASDGSSNSINTSIVELNIVPSQPSVLQLAAGKHHTCALFDNHQLRCWGRNHNGQLGLGHRVSVGDDESPLSQNFVNVGSKVLQVSLGESHTCALLEDKRVKCWGWGGFYGVLGEAIGVERILDPSLVDPFNLGFSVKQIVSGDWFNCALGENGLVKCWGINSFGQLGLGHRNPIGDSSEEVFSRILALDLGSIAKKISAGDNHVCALLEGGHIKCWGYNYYGQLGYGHTLHLGDDEVLSAVGVVSVGQAVLDISAGGFHTCALLEDKNIKCWGYGGNGQLGLGDYNDIGDNELVSSVQSLDFLEDVREVFLGKYHSCVLLANHGVKCWGRSGGVLGVYSESAIIDVAQAKFIDVGTSRIHQLALGENHTCLALDTGEVRCFGSNSFGQLGLGHRRVIGDNEFISERNSSVFPDRRSSVVANFSYSVSDTDVKTIDFDASLSFSTGSMQSYQWNFGDEARASSISPSHSFSAEGSFDVTLTVTDTFGQEAIVTQSVDTGIENLPPYFESIQSFVVEEGKTHKVVLQRAFDLDSPTLTYSIAESPSQGQISDCLDGTTDLICSYQAPVDFVGEIEFSYKANDGHSDSIATVVRLNIVEESSSIIQIASGQLPFLRSL